MSNKTFFNKKTSNKKPQERDNHHFKLYINEESQRFWEIVDFAEENNLATSSTFCKILIDAFDSERNIIKETDEKIQEERQKLEEERQRKELTKDEKIALIKEIGVTETLVLISELYDKKETEQKNLSYLLESKFSQNIISPQQMINLIVFLLEAHTVIMRTDILMNFMYKNHAKLLDSIREYNSPHKVQEFKNHLIKEIGLDVDLFHSKKKEEERLELDKIRREYLKKEKEAWELENYPRKWRQRGMTEEEIRFDEALARGEIEIAGGQYIYKKIEVVEEAIEIDEYNQDLIETIIKDP